MKDKKKLYIILGAVIILIATATLLYFLVFKGDKKPEATPAECDNITGGSYNLVFKSESEILSTMNVCIACPPNTYEDLLKPTKEGYVFEGWFYDESLENAVNVSNSIDISPVAKKDENGCVIGYEDITLYAQWSKEGNNSIKISFDANGGSKVNDIVIKCDDNNTATITKLPISEKDGYNFTSWKNASGAVISEGNKITCNNDLRLIAAWEKFTYKCEDGWTLDGTNCTKSSKVRGSLTCNSDETLIDNYCVKIKATSDEDMKKYTVKTCKKITIGDNYGHTQEYDGVLFPDGVTCFYKVENESKETCATRGFKWNSNDNKCYNTSKMNNTTLSCKSPNYLLVTNPNEYDGINGKNSGCYPKKAAVETCPSGYSLVPSHGSSISCSKTETKPATKVVE